MTRNYSITKYQEAMDEIFNLCQQALIPRNQKYTKTHIQLFNYELITEIEKITEKFDPEEERWVSKDSQ
tara:strand:+ start:746 stop:952 length:207 start_codon:yes stop_codon:yes gene_type:complete